MGRKAPSARPEAKLGESAGRGSPLQPRGPGITPGNFHNFACLIVHSGTLLGAKYELIIFTQARIFK